MSRENLYDIFAREKSGLPKFEITEWKCLPSGGPYTHIQLSGAVYPVIKTRGPRKGHPDYQKPETGTRKTYILSNEEWDNWTATWQSQTGKCRKCVGRGDVMESWSAADGTKYKPCPACGGTGITNGVKL